MPHRLLRSLCNEIRNARNSRWPAGIARALLLAAGLLLSLHAFSGAARAQVCTQDCPGEGDTTLPFISFSPASGTYAQASIPVVVTVSDGQTLDDGSLVITQNGTTITSAFQYTRTIGSPTPRATARGTVTLGTGSNVVGVTICDQSGNCRTSTATYAFGVPGVTVSPDGGAATVQPGPRTQVFTVVNTGPATETFTAQPICRLVETGAPVACTASPASGSLQAGQSAGVTVSYTAGAAGNRISLELRVRQSSALTVQDAGWVEVDVAGAGGSSGGSLAVSLVDLNWGAQISRDECVTVSAGAGAAYECGDLRLVQGVPGMATLGKARAPVLLYNSQQAHVRPTVYADVTLPAGVLVPQQVTATVTINGGGPTYTRTFTGADWQPGTARRIGVQWDGLSNAWGLMPYTLQVTAVYSDTTYATTAQGELMVVNRGDSPFGPGWWLAGLERVFCVCSGGDVRSVHWGGDGSTRMYVPAGPDRWVAQNPDGRPDTLTKIVGGYRRKLQGGGEVVFDDAGRHVRTVSRLGDTTHFVYDGASWRPTYVSVPRRDGVAAGFRFTYSGGYVVSVKPEIGGTTYPGITIGRNGARVASIMDPDSLLTYFGYADAAHPNRVTSRTSRDGTVVTYGYDGAGKLNGVSLALTNTQSIVTGFTAAESRGVNAGSGTISSVAVSQAYTLIDGPRSDVVDQTRIWVTNRGAPRRIRDALGHETVLNRTNVTYPSLVTEVRGPNPAGDSLVIKSLATYDLRGRVQTSTVVNPLGNGQNLTTTYAYDDRWDRPDTVWTPGVAPSVTAYDTLTGNVLWQEQGGSTRRVYFDYHTSGADRGLLARVRQPHPVTGAAGGGGADSLGYDAAGNLRFTRSPLPQAFLTYHYRDHFGRDTLTITPVRADSADTEAELKGSGTRSRTGYDVLGRVAWTESVGPAVVLPAGGRVPGRTVASEKVRVETTYDAMSRPTLVSRWSTPDSAGVGQLVTQYAYDRAGRKTSETALGAGKDSTEYDPAGNAVAAITARGHRITMQYDVLGRLVRREVPSATDAAGCPPGWAGCTLRFPYYPSNGSGGFTAPAENFYYRYDALGNQVYAENMDAKVVRSYYPGGALRTDSIYMRSYAGLDFSQLAYGLEYRYDALGRVRAMQHPGNLTGTVQADSFAYDSVTGALKNARSRQGYVYGFEYDLLGRPVRTAYPGGGAERMVYDEQGRRVSRVDSITAGVLANDAYTYDARGKTTFVSGQTGGETTNFYNWYSGLGNLLGTDWGNPLDPTRTTEVYVADGMGNQARSTTWKDGNGSPPMSKNVYQTGTGRITSIGRVLSAQPGETALPDSTYRHYDNGGNVTWGVYKGWGPYFNGSVGVNHITLTRNYYGADQVLRVVQVHDETTNGSTWSQNGSYAEYRYDPLGRRIMERTRRDSVCFSTSHDCESTLTRFVWAGDHLLWEMRVPGGNDVPTGSTGLDATSAGGEFYGRVSYFHAGGIDKPLLITKDGVESVVPRETWRGQFHAGTSPTTGARRDCPVGTQTNCLQIAWPGMQTNAAHSWGGEQPDIRVWYGGLVDGMRDASGQMYMRNRYYDPATGQFTQTDPIGLAGGLNAYGFAAGDPVTYNDPFGLNCWRIDRATGRRYPIECPKLESGAMESPAFYADPVALGTGLGAGRLARGPIARGIAGVGAGWSSGRVVWQAASMLRSSGMAELRAAAEAGVSASVRIGGRTVTYDPAPFSGMTNFADDTFHLGREAFASQAELTKTVLHELYRLTFQAGGEASGASAARATNAAANFAEKAYDVGRSLRLW